jgi:hypothetical protein
VAKNVVEMWDRDDGRWQRTPIRGERAYMPASLEDLEKLRGRLTSTGHPISVVNAITGWLVAKALGEADTTSRVTRAKYRKILAELDEPVRSAAA